jgi:hypothetical protein
MIKEMEPIHIRHIIYRILTDLGAPSLSVTDTDGMLRDEHVEKAACENDIKSANTLTKKVSTNT